MSAARTWPNVNGPHLAEWHRPAPGRM